MPFASQIILVATLLPRRHSLRWAKKSKPGKSSIEHWNKPSENTSAVSSLQRLTRKWVTMKRHLNPCSKLSSSDQPEYRGSGWIPDSTLCEAIPDFRTLFAASEFPAADHVVLSIS